MPEDMHDEFLHDCAKGFIEYDEKGEFSVATMQYKLFVVFARK